MSQTCYQSACSSTHMTPVSAWTAGRISDGFTIHRQKAGSLCVIVILISFAPIAALSVFHESHEGHGLVWTRL